MVFISMSYKMTGNRFFVLKRRPVGLPAPDDFELRTAQVPQVPDGMVLLKAVYISVDPYLRGKMSGTKIPGFEVGAPISSKVIAQVVESKLDGFHEGQYVSHYLDWMEYQLSDGKGLSVIEPGAFPLSAYLGVLGVTGLSAYFALTDFAKPREGETLVVSGAAGAVGSIAGQIGKIMGCRVVGIVGSGKKADLIKGRFGFDDAIVYKSNPDIRPAIAKACPAGVDMYFDNVGGPVSYGVLSHINSYGRVVVCGTISNYNDVQPAVADDLLPLVVYKFLSIRGFLIADFASRFPEGIAKLGGWLTEGRLHYAETTEQGFDKLPGAFLGLFGGKNEGKMIVKV